MTQAARQLSPQVDTHSPGLELFRTNAFGVLRIPIRTPTREAVWRGEKLLARVRAGAPLPTVETISWLAGVDELEIQQAIQRVEEPLPRLVAQSLWFDFEDDPVGEALQDALSTADMEGLAAYLSLTEENIPGLPEFVENASPVELEATVEDRLRRLIPHRVNQANLRILLGLSGLAGIDLDIRMTHASAVTVPRGNTEPHRLIKFYGEYGLRVARDPHLALVSEQDSSSSVIATTLLQQALQQWGRILSDPHYHAYLKDKIADADDELVTEDNAETILTGIRTRVTDTVVAEMKDAMLGGDEDKVARLVSVIANSGLETRTWSLALPPLRALFRAQLDELDGLLTTADQTHPDEIRRYLTRLVKLRARWGSVDARDMLGLSSELDRGVARAFDKIKSIYQETDELNLVDELSIRAHQAAISGSLKKRIEAFQEQVKKYREMLCNFCGKRGANLDYCGAVTGKREEGRTRGFNSTTIHYGIKGGIVPRCEPCARSHALILSIRRTSFIVLALSSFVVSSIAADRNTPTVILVLLTLGIGFAGAVIASHVVAGYVTPKSDVSFHSTWSTAAYKELAREGYSVHSFLDLHAGRRLQRDGVQSMHDSGLYGCLSALPSLLYLLFMIFVVFANCFAKC